MLRFPSQTRPRKPTLHPSMRKLSDRQDDCPFGVEDRSVRFRKNHSLTLYWQLWATRSAMPRVRRSLFFWPFLLPSAAMVVGIVQFIHETFVLVNRGSPTYSEVGREEEGHFLIKAISRPPSMLVTCVHMQPCSDMLLSAVLL